MFSSVPDPDDVLINEKLWNFSLNLHVDALTIQLIYIYTQPRAMESCSSSMEKIKSRIVSAINQTQALEAAYLSDTCKQCRESVAQSELFWS